jgi:hypothetical protein
MTDQYAQKPYPFLHTHKTRGDQAVCSPQGFLSRQSEIPSLKYYCFATFNRRRMDLYCCKCLEGPVFCLCNCAISFPPQEDLTNFSPFSESSAALLELSSDSISDQEDPQRLMDTGDSPLDLDDYGDADLNQELWSHNHQEVHGRSAEVIDPIDEILGFSDAPRNTELDEKKYAAIYSVARLQRSLIKMTVTQEIEQILETSVAQVLISNSKAYMRLVQADCGRILKKVTPTRLAPKSQSLSSKASRFARSFRSNC